MKHFMLPRNTILKETHTNDSPASLSSPSSNSSKSKTLRRQKSTKENAPPPDPNFLQPSLSQAKMKSPLPPRPPNPLKRKLGLESFPESLVPGVCDSGVKVVVRVRPLNKEEEGEMIVQKITNDSLSVNGQTMTFDSVADMETTQMDIFQLVGIPLVENCLSGFNSSVFAYGQTGSGKTYTMWGPSNALLEDNLSSDQQGLTPRVFEKLFSRISEEQIKHADKQLNYQCSCSFLEIYNEQITDLLDPSQRNLQIREDVKSGVYVENLTEEYVCTMKDVTQLLLKGLSNRRTGATSINMESSRSHSVFTCVVESRCKSKADGISRFKSSRINLVDLAGSERQKLTGAAGERLKEAGNINRSLSQLGNLINILAEVSQTGKQRHIPYRDSRLTFLLQESLGGNAKLAMICAISPSQSCKSETFSTLRFAQRAKAIKNRAVVNEVMQEDVNYLREVIRQLRDELHRMKANGQNVTDLNGVHSAGWARRSLNILRSFHNPKTLPRIDDDGDEEMEIDEDAVEKLCNHVDMQLAGIEDCHEIKEDTDIKMEDGVSVQAEDCETDIVTVVEPITKSSAFSDAVELNHNIAEPNGEENSKRLIVSMDSCRHPPEGKETIGTSVIEQLDAESLRKTGALESSYPIVDPLCAVLVDVEETPNLSGNGSVDYASPSGLSIILSNVSSVLKSPTPSVSPRISDSRKSLRTSSMLTASQKDLNVSSKLSSEAIPMSFDKSKSSCLSEAPSTQTGKYFMGTTEHLAASLHRGLEIIDSHRQSSAFRRSAFRFSYRTADFKPVLPVEKVDACVQTSRDDGTPKEVPVSFMCGSCNKRVQLNVGEEKDNSNLQLVPVDGPESVDTSKQVPKAVEKVLAGAIRREMVLEEFCAKQTSEIKHLNRLVQQYKHERECNAIITQTREDKILRLESLMDGVLPTEEFMEEEFASLKHEHKLLKEKYDNHPDVLRTKIELKRVQDELEHYQNFCDLGEKEVLLEEIQDLRSQLLYYIDSSSSSARKPNSLLQLTHPCEPSLVPSLSTVLQSTDKTADEKFEQERSRWTVVEGEWISLAEELRKELDASRSLVEKQKHELDSEKRCVEELKEAMQMAMEGNARMLEQYADLEEKHIQLLARHRKIREGIEDVKKAAAKAGVRGAESKFINVLAAEISALKVAREKERQYLKDENKGLQAQLRDTAEAVQAAGELLVRLKEAEEAVGAAQRRAVEAEQESAKAYKQVDQLKKKHKTEVNMLNEIIAGSRLPKEAAGPAGGDVGMPKYDVEEEPQGASDEQYRDEDEVHQFYTDDSVLSKLAEQSSWFSGYDRCNI